MGRRLRQHSSLRTGLRLSLLAAAFAVSGLVALLIVVFNITRDEVSHATPNMTFKSAEVIQDTLPVLRGSINQRIIGVRIDMAGRGNALRLNSLEFAATGTTAPVASMIENARLWTTGSSPDFVITAQSGSTVIKISDNTFSFNLNHTLNPGANYFWLTYDIKPEAAYGPGAVDAECIAINIGALSYQPYNPSPDGKRFTMPNIPYYSTGNNVVKNLNAWNSKRDGTGVPPKQLNAARNTYFIQAGHKMINTSVANLQALVVEKGGELRITSPLRISSLDIACGGMMQMDAMVKEYYCFDEFRMENGANYIHNQAGLFPGKICRLDKGSTQLFYQFGPSTFPQNVTWGNLVIDATTPMNLDLENRINHIAGNFEIRKTSKDNYIYIGNADTIHIGRNFIVSGGRFMGIAGTTRGMLAINVGEDLHIRSGQMFDAGMISHEDAGTHLTIEGDVNLISGTFDFNRSRAGASVLAINSIDKPCRWTQKNGCSVSLGNMIVYENATLELAGEKLGDIQSGRKLVVSRYSALMCGKYQITGGGTFEMQDYATLGVGHSQGLASTEEKGNVITRNRIFHSGASYIFYQGEHPQMTGVFNTHPYENTVRSIIVRKDKPSQSVSLSTNLIVDHVQIEKGDLDQSKNKLIMPRVSQKP